MSLNFWRNVEWKWTPVASGSGQAYAPELNKRCRPHRKPTNKSYRTDEAYIKVNGEHKYLYRAVDSTGQTIDFLLTAKRDAAAAKRFFRKALSSPGNLVSRVINVDKNPAVPGRRGAPERRRHPASSSSSSSMQIPEQCSGTGPSHGQEADLAGRKGMARSSPHGGRCKEWKR